MLPDVIYCLPSAYLLRLIVLTSFCMASLPVCLHVGMSTGSGSPIIMYSEKSIISAFALTDTYHICGAMTLATSTAAGCGWACCGGLRGGIQGTLPVGR